MGRIAGMMTTMVLFFVIPNIIVMQFQQVEANSMDQFPLTPSPSPSSAAESPFVDPYEVYQDIKMLQNPKAAMIKGFLVSNVLSHLKVPQAIKNVLSRSRSCADCVLSKFWGCSFVEVEKITKACYGGIGALCFKQFKGNAMPSAGAMMPFA